MVPVGFFALKQLCAVVECLITKVNTRAPRTHRWAPVLPGESVLKQAENKLEKQRELTPQLRSAATLLVLERCRTNRCRAAANTTTIRTETATLSNPDVEPEPFHGRKLLQRSDSQLFLHLIHSK